jgi:alanine racemase
MDQTMVDVTHIPDVIPGDEVVIVGNQGEGSVTPEEIAGILGTINYEIPSLFTPRVPRVYI